MGALHRILHSLLGAAWKPERVCFSYAPPATAAAHVRFFGCPVDFRCDLNGFVCATKALDVRLPKGDPVMARYAQQYLDSILEQVARHLGMDRRTVHRHLARDAETFSSIVDAVRAELAARYLTTTDRPLAEVADLLGFSGLSALSRWFSARFDCSASAWRAAHRGRMVPAR